MTLGVLLSFHMLGFPDLTVEGSYVLGAAVAARLLVDGANPLVATLTGMVAGALAGISTGLIHTKLNINNILAGILTTTGIFTIVLWVMGRPNTSLLTQSTVFEDVLRRFGAPSGALGTIAVLAVWVLVARLAFGWFLQTDIGLAVRATGNNERMIRGLGVDTDATKVLTLSISNGLVGLTGALVAQNQGFADATMGLGVLVVAVAGIIIGQALILNSWNLTWLLWAVIGGTIVYRALLAGALLLGMPPTALKLVTAVLVILALGLPSYLARQREP